MTLSEALDRRGPAAASAVVGIMMITLSLMLEPDSVELSLNSSGAPPTGLAFLVMGYSDSERPPWLLPGDQVHMFWPPATCHECPGTAHMLSSASRPYLNASKAWWCAQRSYLQGVRDVLQKFPKADYYVMADVDTVVFRGALARFIEVMDLELRVPDERAFFGHGMDLTTSGVGRIIMTGGAALVRGSAFRRLTQHGVLDRCLQATKDKWCYHHSDWILAECLRSTGVNPTGHPAFQQYTCDGYEEGRLVACHSIKRRTQQEAMLRASAAALPPEALRQLRYDLCGSYTWKSQHSRCAEGQARAPAAKLSLAFAIWDGAEAERPAWAKDRDHVLVSIRPPSALPALGGASLQQEPANASDVGEAWGWCLHRERFLDFLGNLTAEFSTADYYFLSGSRTALLRDAAAAFLQGLQREPAASKPGPRDVYMGHVEGQGTGTPFVALADGILLGGSTLRRLLTPQGRSRCLGAPASRQWCDLTVDQVLASCLRRAQPQVLPKSHPGFLGSLCRAGAASEASSPRPDLAALERAARGGALAAGLCRALAPEDALRLARPPRASQQVPALP